MNCPKLNRESAKANKEQQPLQKSNLSFPISPSGGRRCITVLSDNRSKSEELLTEHGLCIYIETGRHKCLLDTGASGLFIDNAQKLGIDLSQVDYVFISHGHADHLGGLPAFLEINQHAVIVLSDKSIAQSFYSKRHGMRKISINFDPEKCPNRFIWIDEDIHLEDDIQVLRCWEQKYPTPKANHTLYKQKNDELVPDDFDHELIVCFGEEQKLVYSGCAHLGLINILKTVTDQTQAAVSVVVGGFHLPDAREEQSFETNKELDEIAQFLNKNYPSTHFVTGHCTGDKAFEQLKKQLNNRLSQFYVGYNQ